MAPAVLVASELRKLNFEYKNEFGVQGLEKCAWACRRSLCRLAQQVTARNLFARGAAPSPGWWRGAALAARGVGRPRVHAFETYGACMHCSIERNQLSTLRILASPPSKCFPHRRHLCGPRSRLRERCGAGHCARLCRTFSRSHHPTLDHGTTWASPLRALRERFGDGRHCYPFSTAERVAFGGIAYMQSHACTSPLEA